MVVGVIGDDADEIVLSVLLVVGDVEEDREEALSEFVEIGVDWLTDNRHEAL